MRRLRDKALVVFARSPRRGRVKTRLARAIGAHAALALHLACLESTLQLASVLPPSIDKWLYLTPGPQREGHAGTLRLRLPCGLRRRQQRGPDLGARLEHAFRQLFTEGYQRVVVIGTDSPALAPARLRQAFASLRRARAVLGPARDGGFYLIGLRGTSAPLAPLFQGIAWGTARAGRQMRARLRRAGLRTALLPLGYDVDTARDLKRLARDLKKNRAQRLAPLRAWLRNRRPG